MVSKKVEASNDVYYRKGEGSTEGSRINLNDLLKKVKDRERHEKKSKFTYFIRSIIGSCYNFFSN